MRQQLQYNPKEIESLVPPLKKGQCINQHEPEWTNRKKPAHLPRELWKEEKEETAEAGSWTEKQ